MSATKVSILLFFSGGGGAFSSLILNNIMKNSKEYWYIGSILANDAITK